MKYKYMRIVENLVIALLVLWFATGLSACKDDSYPEGPLPGTEYDIPPVLIKIFVTDNEGNDLLNPEVKNTIVNNGIKVLYRDKEYEMHWESEYPSGSRSIPVVWNGLQICKPIYVGGRYFLTFGDFDRMTCYEDEEFVVDWGDGSWNTVFRFSNSFWWENHEPQNVFYLYVNDEKQKEGVEEIMIIKPFENGFSDK